MNETKIKIADMGTTGLIQWAVTGNRRMMGARIGRAKKIIARRTGTWKAVNAFNKAVNAAYDRMQLRARVLPSLLPEDDGRLVWPEDEGHPCNQ